jgi:thiol-disulfide isomerase/thioredoxin
MQSDKKTALVLGISIVIAVTVISTVFSFLDSQHTNDMNTSTMTEIDKSQFKKAPELQGISGYINTTPDELKKQMKGKVVLYDIWTYSCINCIRTLPYLKAWDEKYSDQGLLIIGIHSPEFEFEKDIGNVRTAVAKYGINYPVVLDNDKKIWDAFENRYWPRKYMADSEGFIIYDHIGEGAYDETEKVIQKLLKERSDSMGINMPLAENLVDIKEFEHSSFRTPELYFGFGFAPGRNQLGNSEGFVPNQNVIYSLPDSLNLHYFYLDGTWTNLKGSMKLVSDSGMIVLPYSGKEVNIVTAGKADLDILLDGHKIPSESAGDDVDATGVVHTQNPSLYNIVKTDTSEQHTLKILVKNPGFEIFTFTFG